MRKLLLSILLIGILLPIMAQELEENEVDEFTGSAIKRTSWETLNMTMKFTAYFRISKINENLYFDLKLMIGGGEVFSIDEGDQFMLKLENDEIVKLSNLEFTITCTGCGARGISGSAAQGIQVTYPITPEQFNMLKNNTVSKIRIYTSDGYIENEFKLKYYSKLLNALMLVE